MWPVVYCSSSTVRQSSRMSSSSSAWVWTKTSRAPAGGRGQLAGNPGAAVLLLRGGDQQHVAVRQHRRGAGRGSCPADSVSSVVSGSGQSISTRSAKAGRSECTTSTELRVDAEDLGREVRAADEHGPPRGGPGLAARGDLGSHQGVDQGALAGAVPPSVATTRGASSRTRIEPARWPSRRTSARQVSAGCHSGAASAQRSIAPPSESISASSSRWANSGRVILKYSRRDRDEGTGVRG